MSDDTMADLLLPADLRRIMKSAPYDGTFTPYRNCRNSPDEARFVLLGLTRPDEATWRLDRLRTVADVATYYCPSLQVIADHKGTLALFLDPTGPQPLPSFSEAVIIAGIWGMLDGGGLGCAWDGQFYVGRLACKGDIGDSLRELERLWEDHKRRMGWGTPKETPHWI